MSEEPADRPNGENTFETRVLAEFAALNNRLTALEEKVGARLRETRPIWEGVLSQLKLIDSKFDVMTHEWLELRGEMNLLKKQVPPAA